VAFAAAPIVGQNFAAGKFARVRETFMLATLIGSCIMVALTLFCQWGSALLIHGFTKDPTAIAVGSQYLQVTSWNFLASGFVFTCSAVFQGLGNTVPALVSSASRLLSFVLPVLWMSRQPHFEMIHVWYMSVASVALQAAFSLWLVRREFRLRLIVAPQPIPAPT
jgi:MATE family, multidrug efflux pump